MNANMTTQQLVTAINNGDKPVVLDFYADWCGPCRMQAPIFIQAEAALAGRADFYKVNVDDHPELASQFGVSSIPTIAVVHQGRLHWRNVGVTSKEAIAAAINSL